MQLRSRWTEPLNALSVADLAARGTIRQTGKAPRTNHSMKRQRKPLTRLCFANPAREFCARWNMTGIIGLHTAQRVARARENPGPHLCLRPFSWFCLTPFWFASSILALRQFCLLLLFFASFGLLLLFVSFGLLLVFCFSLVLFVFSVHFRSSSVMVYFFPVSFGLLLLFFVSFCPSSALIYWWPSSVLVYFCSLSVLV